MPVPPQAPHSPVVPLCAARGEHRSARRGARIARGAAEARAGGGAALARVVFAGRARHGIRRAVARTVGTGGAVVAVRLRLQASPARSSVCARATGRASVRRRARQAVVAGRAQLRLHRGERAVAARRARDARCVGGGPRLLRQQVVGSRGARGRARAVNRAVVARLTHQRTGSGGSLRAVETAWTRLAAVVEARGAAAVPAAAAGAGHEGDAVWAVPAHLTL